MSIGVLTILAQPVDQYDCIRCELKFDPNGHIANRFDYSAGNLYIKRNEFNDLVDAFEKQGKWSVDVRQVPSYAQMQGPERS